MKVIAVSSDRNSSMFYWAALKVQSNEIEASEQVYLARCAARRS